jgi:hypothetical protein
MESCLKFYIDGAWVDPIDPKPFDVINQPMSRWSVKLCLAIKKM